MAQYVLNSEFQLLGETAGVIVNISTVKVELSEQPVFGTGVILEPQKIVYFNNILYAACAPSDCGVAVIGVLPGNGIGGNNPIVITPEEEYITYADVQDLFSANPFDWSQGSGGQGFQEYLDSLFGGQGGGN